MWRKVMDKILKSRLALSSLTVFRGLLDDTVVSSYSELLEAVHGIDIRSFVDAYCKFYYNLLSKDTVSVSDYLTKAVLYDRSIFKRQADGGKAALPDPILKAAEHDLDAIKTSLLPASAIKEAAQQHFDDTEYTDLISNLPEWEVSAFDITVEKLCDVNGNKA